MNLSKTLTLIYLLASSLIILCSSARAQESPSAALTRTPPAGARRRPKIPDKCEMPAPYGRNWELIGHEYVIFDYVLCPPGLQPPAPLVSVWLTTKGDGFAIEKWAEGRDGADSVSVYRGKKMAFTLYRDLDAVPLSLFKAEIGRPCGDGAAAVPGGRFPPHTIREPDAGVGREGEEGVREHGRFNKTDATQECAAQ